MLQFTVIGNIGGDAELHNENGNEFVTFKVAHNERYTRQDGTTADVTTWVSCVMNGKNENLTKYLVKGQQVWVCGDGSVRTYHSKTQHQMVAGVDIRVRQIQLLGAKPDAVPSVLIDDAGVMHNVTKYYQVADVKNKMLYGRNGEMFDTDKHGWISSHVEPSATTTGEQGNKSDAPFI